MNVIFCVGNSHTSAMTCENPLQSAEIQNFVEEVSDFLHPMNDADLACALGLCGHDACPPKVWKCRVGPHYVALRTTDGPAVKEARENCMAGDDTFLEFGGQGQNIVVPIRDDFLPHDLVARRSERAAQRPAHQFALIMLGIAFALGALQLVRAR